MGASGARGALSAGTLGLSEYFLHSNELDPRYFVAPLTGGVSEGVIALGGVQEAQGGSGSADMVIKTTDEEAKKIVEGNNYKPVKKLSENPLYPQAPPTLSDEVMRDARAMQARRLLTGRGRGSTFLTAPDQAPGLTLNRKMLRRGL